MNADRGLYYLLFGEALLNDGVTFVLFEGLLKNTNTNIEIQKKYKNTRLNANTK